MRRYILLILVSLLICLLLAGCQHEHSWTEATCTEPRTCSSCGETEGEALGHSWIDATCTEPRTCSRCGETEGAALGHSWVDATCTEPRTCSACGATDGTPLGHVVDEWTLITESTCSEAGIQQGICSICGKEVTDELPLLEHTPGDWEIEQEATVEYPGTRVIRCTACGTVLESESYNLTEEEIEEAYKSQCTTYSYDELARNPNSYTGQYVQFTGEVIQVLQETNGNTVSYDLRVNVTRQSYGWYSDTIYVVYEASADDDRILEDDIITLYGVVYGEYTYESIFGQSITLPLILAEYVDIN